SAVFYDRLTIHHEGNAVNYNTDLQTVTRDLKGILISHVDLGYGDIAYHLVIDRAGRVWEGRSLMYEGAHVSGQNEKNIGVMLLGNFEEQKPSEEQIAAMKLLVSLLRNRYRIKKHRIYGHCDLGPSLCPGKHLYEHVVALRES
ncbi:MAG: N-acetylmuramoyl-L-alanine amidase, partial [Lentisphaerae bacterium]|nr:N-acetylmuramoyl-L-alanine amidase [Lentisphaerota bacterium]